MCMMCEDEKSYQAYLAYLDAMEKGGGKLDHDQAMAAAMKAMEEAAKAAWNRDPWADDKTLSTGAPFVCSPVDK